MSKYKICSYVRLSRDDDYSESDSYSKTNEFKRSKKQKYKKITRYRIVKYIDNIFIQEDKSIEISFKEDINYI